MGVVYQAIHAKTQTFAALKTIKVAQEGVLRSIQKEGACLGNLAILFQYEGNLEEAKTLYENAISRLREVGSRQTEGVTLGNFSTLLRVQKRFEEAKTCLKCAIFLAKEAGDFSILGAFQGNLGNFYQEQGTLEKAQFFLEKALQSPRHMGKIRMEGVWIKILAQQALWKENNFSKSNTLAKKSYDLLLQVGDPIEIGKLLCFKGHLMLA